MAHLDFEAPLVELEERIAALKELTDGGAPEAKAIDAQIETLQAQAEDVQRKLYADLDVWKKVQLSRHPDRPYLRDYLALLFEDVVELHGDRTFRDDPAIISGFARFEGEIVAVIGHQKGRTAKDKAHRNFGMAHPEGYRKALAKMKLAEKFGLPVVALIDTPGDSRNRKMPLISTNPAFLLEEIRLVAKMHHRTGNQQFHVLLPLDAPIEVSVTGCTVQVPKYSACFIPAKTGFYSTIPTEPTRILRVC